MGAKKRDSQDFPAAGLRWNVVFAPGSNHLRAVASGDGVSVTDEIEQVYQTEAWGKPAALRITERMREGNRITVETRLFDARGVLCLDARNFVRFSLSGAGRLIDNLGTTRASRELQLANGRAEISLDRSGGCTVTAHVEGLPAQSLRV
jgi:beta-galactosidase